MFHNIPKLNNTRNMVKKISFLYKREIRTKHMRETTITQKQHTVWYIKTVNFKCFMKTPSSNFSQNKLPWDLCVNMFFTNFLSPLKCQYNLSPHTWLNVFFDNNFWDNFISLLLYCKCCAIRIPKQKWVLLKWPLNNFLLLLFQILFLEMIGNLLHIVNN